MLNQVVLVGRLLNDIEIKELENGQKDIHFTLVIPRYFKNKEGAYENDFIPVTTNSLYYNGDINNLKLCQKGDIIGVKGRVESEPNRIVIVSEKITFLTQHKGENE